MTIAPTSPSTGSSCWRTESTKTAVLPMPDLACGVFFFFFFFFFRSRLKKLEGGESERGERKRETADRRVERRKRFSLSLSPPFLLLTWHRTSPPRMAWGMHSCWTVVWCCIGRSEEKRRREKKRLRRMRERRKHGEKKTSLADLATSTDGWPDDRTACASCTRPSRPLASSRRMHSPR